uniref:Uncharacterized protein n=1 Tax=Brassica campestris TaxID=3711 RepID=A0A3P5Y0G5_BRACM|nr:unnamed protein product [Brassica rapa]
MLSQFPGQLSKSQQILKVYRLWCLFKPNLNASSWIHLIQWLMGTYME